MRPALFALDCLCRPTTAKVLAGLRATREADQRAREKWLLERGAR